MIERSARTVYQRPDGSWAIKQDTAERPSSVHKSLLEAEQIARELLKSEGGGVLTTAIGWSRNIVLKRYVVAA